MLGIMNYLGNPCQAPQRYINHCEDWHQQRQIKLGTTHAKSYMKRQMPSRLRYSLSSTVKKNLILRNWCIRCRIRDRFSTGHRHLWFPWDETPDNIALHPMAFAYEPHQHRSKVQQHREALGILHGLEKFHHCCFNCKVSIIKDHKPLVAVFKKAVATLLQRLQWFLLCINQWRIRILYKPGLWLHTTYWLCSYTHSEGKDEEIAGMSLTIDAVEACTDIPECMIVEEMQHRQMVT